MKILNAVWFTERGSNRPIGIVICENDHGYLNAYIGTADGFDESADAHIIARFGAKFPLNAAKELMK